MILEMAKVRLLGPKRLLRPVLSTVHDLELVHLSEPARGEGIRPHALAASDRRRRRHLRQALVDVEACVVELRRMGASVRETSPAPVDSAGRAAMVAHRVRAELVELAARRDALAEEREALALYQPLVAEFARLLGDDRNGRRFSAYLLLLRRGADDAIRALRERLTELAGREHELRTRALPTGETALLLLVPAVYAETVDELLAGARVEVAPVPATFAGVDLIDALPRMGPRLEEVAIALDDVDARVGDLARTHGETLAAARRSFHDELLELDAQVKAVETERAFVLEGWLPASHVDQLARAIAAAHGELVAVEVIGRDRWHGDEAPVVLANPKLFEPFERLTSMLPLPRYGTVDPTPFVAVFFPMLFGLIVGDVGYGAVMLAIALVLARGARRGGLRRDVSRIAGAVACFTIIFGFLYGELFGDLGHRYLGMDAVWMARDEAVLPFLTVAIALGVAHLTVGLVLGALSKRRSDPRGAIGRGISVIMLGLIVVALLAVFEELPSALLSPAIIALLVAFPVLVAVEGFAGVLELVSMLGHVLSYARVMALGTASVLLAVVANRMAGAFGTVAIGVAFALLFHLVNFALAVFSPAIHVFRLHFVEFFGTFYSSGGARYEPLAHWTPASEAGS